MKSLSSSILLLMFLVGLAGCQQDPEPPRPSEVESRDEVEVSEPPVRPADPPAARAVEGRASALAERLMRAINARDAATLSELSAIPPEIPDPDYGQAAIRDYDRYFGGSAVDRVERVSSDAENATSGGDARLVFELIARNGTRKPVLIYYEARFDSMRVYDEFLRYSGRVHAYAGAIVEAIQASDAEDLAHLLSVDDLDFPVPLARKAISNYAERFDLETVELAFVGLEPSDRFRYDRPFLFSIRGTKDGRPQTNAVRVVIGDGLLSWQDPLIPNQPAV